MLMRSDPFREFDRLTGQAFGGRFRPTPMPIDAFREDDHFVVHFDLPGVDPDAIELTVEKNVLTVTGERRPAKDGREGVVAAERPHGVFSRQLFLGESLDTDRVEASYDHGVLTVTIPVAEQAKPRKVPIGTAAGSTAIEARAS